MKFMTVSFQEKLEKEKISNEKKKLQEERDRWIIMKFISLKGTLDEFQFTLQVKKWHVP